MAGYAPSFLGSTDRSFSQYSVVQSVRDRLLDVEGDNIQEDKIEDPLLYPHQSETASLRDQPPIPPPVRRPQGPPGPNGSLHSFRGPGTSSTLTHADPFATIVNPRKHKAHSEVFSALTGQLRGSDQTHIIL